MPRVYPLSLADFSDKLRIVSAPFVLKEQQQLSSYGTGEVLAAQLAPARWTALVQLKPELHYKARELQALIESLRGPIRSFFLVCPTNCYPAKDPGGKILSAAGSTVVVSTITNGGMTISLGGLPAGYELSTGDALSIDYASGPVRRAYHRLAEPAVASGVGITGSFDLSSPLTAGIAVGAVVTLLKPSAKMFVLPDGLTVTHAGNYSTLSFQTAQRP